MRWYRRRTNQRPDEQYSENRAIVEWRLGRPFHHGNGYCHDSFEVVPNQCIHTLLRHLVWRVGMVFSLS